MEPEITVNQAKIKLPDFFDDIRLWLVIVEANFQLSRLTSERSKFLNLIASLPKDVLQTVLDKLETNSATPYTDLKEALLDRHRPSIQTSIQQLLSEHSLGDQTPTALLRSMQQTIMRINPDANPETDPLLKHSFMKILPVHTRQIVCSHAGLSLTEAAVLADEILRSTSIDGTGICKVAEDTVHAVSKTPLPVSQFTRQFADGLCSFHAQFGFSARNCRQPCSWPRAARNTRGDATTSSTLNGQGGHL
jgi:hypothetical protein